MDHGVSLPHANPPAFRGRMLKAYSIATLFHLDNRTADTSFRLRARDRKRGTYLPYMESYGRLILDHAQIVARKNENIRKTKCRRALLWWTESGHTSNFG